MIYLILITICVVLLYIYLIKPMKYWETRNIPCVKPLPIFGNMAKIVFRRISMVEGLQELGNNFKNSRYFGLYQFLVPTLVVTDPDLIKQIGIKDFEHFLDHRTFVDSENDPLFGNNLFLLTGQKWRHMRSTLSPAFTSSKMKSMFFLMSDCAEQFADYFVNNSTPGQHTTIEMKDILSRFANDVIATCAFGIKCDSLSDRKNQFYLMGKKATDFNGIKGLKFFMSSFSPYLAKLLKIRIIDLDVANFFRDVIKTTVDQREKQSIYRPDMIHLLMQAKKGKLTYEESVKNKDEDTGFATVEESHVGKQAAPKMADLTIDDMTAQAMIFFLAGFDGISTMMSHMANELAVNPDIQQKLQAEIDETLEICVDGKVTYDAITKMKYLDMVVCESLRKWPAGAFTDRVCNADKYVINPVHPNEKPVVLNRGDVVWFPFYSIHRDPKNYPNPDKFDPERFSDENKGNIKPNTYVPFGFGPRNCIGSRFALLEAKVMFFYLLSKLDIVVCEKTQIPLRLSRTNVNPVSEKGFWLGLKPRIKKTK